MVQYTDKIMVIYHGNCYDGLTAAWVARHWLRDVCGYVEPELVPAQYGDPPPDVTGRRVYVLDFSYPRDVLLDMEEKAQALVVIDHHATAQEACEGLKFCKFNMTQSGAGMAWRHFFNAEPPRWIAAVEDRDIWRFALPGTASAHAYMASLPMTMDAWDELSRMPFSVMMERGAVIEQYIKTYCEKTAKQAFWAELVGHAVVAVNAPYLNCSELLHHLLEKFSEVVCAVSYYQSGECSDTGQLTKWNFSLRSRPDFDCSLIAKAFGGGGHKQAAGFSYFAGGPYCLNRKRKIVEA